MVRINKILIFLMLLFVQKTEACICLNYNLRIDSLQQLKSYDFIAHVKILDDQDFKKPTKKDLETIGRLTIKVIELFKGNDIETVLEYDKNSSCDIGLSKGEEWIFFGKSINGKIAIEPCDRNKKYKKSNELRDWKYEAGFYELSQLRKLYNHSVKQYLNESHIELYSNGKKEIEETYVNGKLQGVRKIWYPNGVLFCKQNYINDTLDGKSEWFYPSGQIYDEDYYLRGKPCNVSRLYFDSTTKKEWFVEQFKTIDDSLFFYGNKIQTQYETVFDSYGRALISREYSRFGKIYREETIDPDRKFSVDIFYHDNGLISSIMYSLNDKFFGHYQTYDENGFPDNGWDYDENGEVIK